MSPGVPGERGAGARPWPLSSDRPGARAPRLRANAAHRRHRRRRTTGDRDPVRRVARASGFARPRLGVGERIAWLGAGADLERWYAAADIVVLPSRYEPFGNVHLEALAAGLPVVASARAGGAEVIEDGVNGSIVNPTDPRAITAALERFRERPDGDVAEAARRSAEPYTYAAQVSGFARIYSRCTRATYDFP